MNKLQLLMVILGLILSACGAALNDGVPLPTRLELPTLTPSDIPTETFTPTITPSAVPTATFSATPSITPIPSETPTVTPSTTITDTITPTPSDTFTPTNTATATLEPNPLLLLAAAANQATFLPPTFRATFPPPVSNAALTPGGVATGVNVAPVVCSFALPSGISTIITQNPALANSLRCSTAPNPSSISAALQVYERGLMIWVQGTPGTIYVLFNDGRFSRFDDTFTDGVDPTSGGETPPTGLFEPVRGFGKVWRSNPDVRNGLGWATGGEDGTAASLLPFEGGRALYLIDRAESFILIDDPGAQSGTWIAYRVPF